MNRILFISPFNVADSQNKGTPLRIVALFRVMRARWGSRIQPLDISRHRKGSWMRELWVRRWDFDIAFCNTHGGIPPMLFCKFLLRKAVIIDIHGSLEEERYFRGEVSYIRKIFLRHLYRLALGPADLVCYVSEFAKKQLPPWIRKKTIVVYPGFEPRSLAMRQTESQSPPTSPNPITIGYIGNSQSYQGIETILRIAKRLHKNGRLIKVVIGSSDKVGFSALLNKECPEYPHWLETHFNLSHTEARALLESIDILPLIRPLIPLSHESFPAKVPEYLASGKTCIFSKFSDLPNILRDGRDAYFIPSGANDVDEGYRLIEEILNGQKPLLDIQKVQRRAREIFSWQATTDRLTQQMERL